MNHFKTGIIAALVAAIAGITYLFIQKYIPTSPHSTIEQTHETSEMQSYNTMQDSEVLAVPVATAKTKLMHMILKNKADMIFLTSEKKPFVIMLHTSWCPACVAAEKEFPEILHHFGGSVALYSVDLEQGEELVAAMEEAGFITKEITAIPTFIIINPETNSHESMQGFPGTEKMINKIKETCDLKI